MTDTIGTTPSLTGNIVDERYSGPGDWLAPSAAAERLGCSERTLWRRVDAGKLAKRVIAGRAQVYAPTPDVLGAAPETPDRPEIDAGGLVRVEQELALAILQEMRDQHATGLQRHEQQQDEIRQAQARIVELERTNAALEERLTPWPVRLRRWLGLR